MAHVQHKLTPAFVERKSRMPGAYCDGGGLWLYVSSKTAASWVYAYRLNGKDREMGIGPYPEIPLQRDPKAKDAPPGAREMAAEWRAVKARGLDPMEVRESERTAKRLADARRITFENCAEQYIAAHRAGWHNAKHAAQWTSTLATYVEPELGKLPVQEIDTALVMKVLEPIWATKPETASRVRQRIEAVLDWAKLKGSRQGDNPARWRGHLEKLLPARAKVRRVEHHAALPYGEMSAFVAALLTQEGVAAQALEFAILTAARTSEVLLARWSEFDLNSETWTVPAARMKRRREHRVPLSTRAVEILKGLLKQAGSNPAPDKFVFPGAKPGKPLSNMAFLMLLRRMGRNDMTAHGFRSTFRDWAAERTNYPREVCERALAHTVESKTEAAYFRADLYAKRTLLMAAWGEFCTAPAQDGAKVVAIRKA